MKIRSPFNLLLFLVIAAVLVALAFWKLGYAPSSTSSITPTTTTTPTTTNPGPATVDDLIRVDTPRATDVITSPVTISGQARGQWYFEAVFPIQLLDGNGQMIASTQGRAQGDWTTTDYVPFAATISFSKPATPNGTLVLEQDDPSGRGLNKKISIPVVFK